MSVVIIVIVTCTNIVTFANLHQFTFMATWRVVI